MRRCNMADVNVASIPLCLCRSVSSFAQEIIAGRRDICSLLSEDDRGVYIVGLLLLCLVIGTVMRERYRLQTQT